MSYGYIYNTGVDSIMTTLLMAYGIYIVTAGLIALGTYIFKGIGLYTIAKSQGDENAWLAFIPFARKYQQGELAGEIQLKTKSISRPGIWLLGFPIAWGILSYLIGMIFSIKIVGKAIRYGLFGYNTYNSLDSEITGLIGFLLFFIALGIVYKIFYKILLILIDVKILSQYTSGNMPIIHSIFSAFIPLYEAICFFVISRRIAKENAAREYAEKKDAAGEYARNTADTMYRHMDGYHAYTGPMQEETMSESTMPETVMPEDMVENATVVENTEAGISDDVNKTEE